MNHGVSRKNFTPEGASAIWPPLSVPSSHSFISLFQTHTHTLRPSLCVCVCFSVSVCRWCFGSSLWLWSKNNKNCPVGIRSHIPGRPSSFALSPSSSSALCFFRAAIFSQHRWSSLSNQRLHSLYSLLSLFFISVAYLILWNAHSTLRTGMLRHCLLSYN